MPVVLAVPYAFNAVCLQCRMPSVPYVFSAVCLQCRMSWMSSVPVAPNAGGEPPRHGRTAAWVKATIGAVGSSALLDALLCQGTSPHEVPGIDANRCGNTVANKCACKAMAVSLKPAFCSGMPQRQEEGRCKCSGKQIERY